MNQPLKIGNQIFTSYLIQGPLAGVSSAPFRRLVWQYSRPAFTYTEMISCKTLIYQQASFYQRFVKKDKTEGPLCFQLMSNNPTELALGVKIAVDCGADLIDLNCGCPVAKIRKKQGGSSLLSNASLLHQLIDAMKQSTTLPVSIKIRVDGQSNDQFNQEITKVIANSGLDFLTVHGRHWTEHYETPCRLDQITYFVKALSIPVIGNGDVADILSLQNMLKTGCAGVMIGRAGVGQPWLISQLMAELQEQHFDPPSLHVIGDIFKTHIFELAHLMSNEKFAVLAARKLAKYYARQLRARDEFCSKVNTCEQISVFNQLCDEYFKNP